MAPRVQKYFEVIIQVLCQKDARFKALEEQVFIAPSDFNGIFYHPNHAIGTMCNGLIGLPGSGGGQSVCLLDPC